MEFIESLTLRFYRANTFLDEEPRGASRPVFLSFLKTLSLEIRSRTQKDLLRRVMNMIDAPNASKMSIYMKYDSVGDRVGPEEWISGLFESPDGMIRTFPNVEELEVVIQDLSCILLPYYKLLRAVPRVRTLSFDTPSQVSAPMIRNIGHSYGCLRDLRSLRIKNCAGGGMHDVEMLVRYFQELEKRNELERFEKLELEGCSKFSEFKHKFENLLESRFVWKD
ncbi:hypothetical protein SCHPADRAFT_625061 [Schizopora paradoxa]|uniref:F-box domain-containing protein n=1 Tax=Schizopora paradoxa TaxID=27342 RepID=A0A0H2R875_9AGAM|nr:hypothetical protein SCHPADRAFT_625061 [Schizopora paradoxa]